MISVVVPLYNKAAHVAHTLGSVLAQTCGPYEIIVIDDGSTDNSSSIVRQYPNVRLVFQENSGVSVARNRGLNEARGKYVAFLDADDYWLPTHLETLYELIEQWPEFQLASTSHYIKRFDELYLANSSLSPGWQGVIEDFFKTYATSLSLVNSSTACVNRQALLEKGGFPVGVTRGEDIIAWSRLALDGMVVHKAVPTVVYNQDAENRATPSIAKELPGSLVYLAELLDNGGLNPMTAESVERFFDRVAFYTAAGFYFNGDRAGADSVFELVHGAQRYKTALAIRTVMLCPLPVLRIARRLRHKRVRGLT